MSDTHSGQWTAHVRHETHSTWRAVSSTRGTERKMDNAQRAGTGEPTVGGAGRHTAGAGDAGGDVRLPELGGRGG